MAKQPLHSLANLGTAKLSHRVANATCQHGALVTGMPRLWPHVGELLTPDLPGSYNASQGQ